MRTNYDIGTQTLTQSGTYLLLLEGRLQQRNTSSFGFNIIPQGHVSRPRCRPERR